MCGIFGIWNFDGKPVDLGLVEQATTTLRHRGPDDEGYLLINTQTGRTVSCGGRDTDERLSFEPIDAFSGENFDLALGFRRLAILDPSPAGHQPMSSADGRFWIVFNGQIYNHVELRTDLSAHGHKFRTGTDTEVLLAAYQQWGPECLSRLNGMWAFVVWDGAEKRLFCARDRFGIKPLYFASDDRRIMFASEIKALVGDSGVPFVPSDEAVYRYLVAGMLPSPRAGETFFQGVKALPAAHWMTIRRADVAQQRYYTLGSAIPDGRQLDISESIEEYRRLLTEAVRLRLRADVPIGSCLSGGVDSSSIVCIINQLMDDERLPRSQIGDRQRTFSAVYDTAGRFNEREYIEKVLKDTQAQGYFTFPTLERLRDEIEDVVWHQDEPFVSTSMFAQWCVMKEARERSVEVLLDGQGADEQLAGYRPFSLFLSELLRRGEIGHAVAESRAIQRQTGIPAWSPLMGALRYLLPSQVMHTLRRTWYGRQRDQSVLNPDFAGECDRGTIADWKPFTEHGRLDSHLRVLLEESSLPHLLRYEDRNSMAFGVESRVPYLDHRVVEFSLSQPSSLRMRDGWTKWILRKAVEDIVPGDIVWRKDKVGFETPEVAWLKHWISSNTNLFPPDAPCGAYLDLRAVRTAIASWIQNGDEAAAPPVWRWINLDLWLDCFRQTTVTGGRQAR